MIAGGRTSSMCRSRRMLEAMEMVRQAAAAMVVRRAAVISKNSGLESTMSFQVSALEDQDRAAQGHRRVEQCIERVLQDELQSERLLMRDRANHVERGEVGHQIGHGRGDPSGNAGGQGSKSAKVVGKAADNE